MMSFLYRFPGFREVRLVPGRSDIAFVEYETEIQVGLCSSSVQHLFVCVLMCMTLTLCLAAGWRGSLIPAGIQDHHVSCNESCLCKEVTQLVYLALATAHCLYILLS